MKEYLLKQLKATCVLFSIACKINLGQVKNYGNPGGRGGQKPLPSIVGGVDFFWNNPMTQEFELFIKELREKAESNLALFPRYFLT